MQSNVKGFYFRIKTDVDDNVNTFQGKHILNESKDMVK